MDLNIGANHIEISCLAFVQRSVDISGDGSGSAGVKNEVKLEAIATLKLSKKDYDLTQEVVKRFRKKS